MENLRFELSGDSVVVLYEWLARFNETGGSAFEDQAEQRVLWDLESALESELVEALSTDFATILASARRAVRDSTT